MIIGIFISSPFGAVSAIVGSLVGFGCGYGLGVDSSAITSGLWGYNAVLGSMALFPVFLTPSWQAFLLSVYCAILCSTPYTPFISHVKQVV